jgi:cytochrome c-type biogenesis protein CcmE
MTSGRKLACAVLVVAGTTAYMAYLGAAASWQYYVTSEECLADLGAFTDKRLRVSGKVATNTLQRSHGSKQVAFGLAGNDRILPVVYNGPVPDNLAEEIEVVVEGRLDADGMLHGDKLLTKCASKYASKDPTEPGSDPENEKEGP